MAGMIEECAVDELGEASTDVRRAMKRLSQPQDRMLVDAESIRLSVAAKAEHNNLRRESNRGSARAKGRSLPSE